MVQDDDDDDDGDDDDDDDEEEEEERNFIQKSVKFVQNRAHAPGVRRS